MRPSERGSRIGGVALSVVAISAVAAWALAHATAQLAPAVALAGIAGVVTFAAALAGPLVGRRNRTVATGLVLVGTSVVVGTLHEAGAGRTVALAISGAILFCAAEVADRSLDQARHAEHRPGVARWSPAWVLAVAAGSAGVAYGAISTRGFVADGGPAALAAGTAGAVLVAVLAAVAVRTRSRPGL
jgi:hypothetical protein